MEFIRAFLLILIFYAMVAGLVTSLMTASPWPLVLSAIFGLTLGARLVKKNRSDSWQD